MKKDELKFRAKQFGLAFFPALVVSLTLDYFWLDTYISSDIAFFTISWPILFFSEYKHTKKKPEQS